MSETCERCEETIEDGMPIYDVNDMCLCEGCFWKSEDGECEHENAKFSALWDFETDIYHCPDCHETFLKRYEGE